MGTVHLAIRVFQGVLSDVEVHAEEDPARDRIRTWKEEGNLDSDLTYQEAQVIQKGTPIRTLGLEVPYYNALKRNRIRTVEQLTDMTERRLLFCHRVGRKCVNKVKEALTARGVSLAED